MFFIKFIIRFGFPVLAIVAVFDAVVVVVAISVVVVVVVSIFGNVAE